MTVSARRTEERGARGLGDMRIQLSPFSLRLRWDVMLDETARPENLARSD
ncbi:MAG: hypothetical protein JRN40_00565 [Nitrososphaerota archaeon]|jgi:hypothetical protein|nr:hypothetical protein [Nitrososphaerota archaeon]